MKTFKAKNMYDESIEERRHGGWKHLKNENMSDENQVASRSPATA